MENPDYALFLRKCITYSETLQELIGKLGSLKNNTSLCRVKRISY